jgi:uncharacterized membrane protein YciS (DUF1049 family)
MLRIIKFLFFILIIIIGMAIHLRNDQLVSFNYYLGIIDLSFSLYLAISLCIGAIAGVATTMPTVIKLGHERSKLLSQLRLNEKELQTLRISPIKD